MNLTVLSSLVASKASSLWSQRNELLERDTNANNVIMAYFI